MFAFAVLGMSAIRPRVGETVKETLRRLYKDHKVVSYKQSRIIMYNQVDCEDGHINLIYGDNTYDWKCGGSSIPSATVVNAEHIVPQSFFGKKNPMVSDLHHLFSAPSKLNNRRSNYVFKQMDYDQCLEFCRDNSCSTTRPSNPDEYSCLGNDKKSWMPIKKDRGTVARAIFYFFTMYDDVDISRVGDVNTFKQWNRDFPPSDADKLRNYNINMTQGNSNPYIEDYTLVEKVF